ncbi:MAG: hypothetical protein ACRDQC_10000, partial [Gaiellales bacterium]
AQGIERAPPERKAVGSIPTRRIDVSTGSGAWSMTRRSRAWLAVSGVAACVVVAGVALYGLYVEQWGCSSPPSHHSVSAVEDAFASHSLDLTRVPDDAPNVDAAYRLERPDATLYVLVCTRLCSPRDGPSGILVPGQVQRGGDVFHNVSVWASDSNDVSARRLLRTTNAPVNDLVQPRGPGDRCYVN